ncbi:CtrA inhibitor SciP [Antarctobacter jejuensis]|uniref:CtrA inhibitor SciP n=1 Tax=Antarctobacter jejuensis TaxID=1439938 RepID=UPI003FD596B8
MYLKRIEGPRAVKLPDGSTMTRADLPPSETRRWVASRKAAVVRAVTFGLITQEQAKENYGLSDEELMEWVKAATRHGEDALKVTRVQKYRQP